MNAYILPTRIPTPQFHNSKHLNPRHLRPPLNLFPLKSSGNDTTSSSIDSIDTTPGGEVGSNPAPTPAPTPPRPTKPEPERLEIRYRRGAKSRQRRLQQEAAGTSDGLPKREVAFSSAPKKWEEMTVAEKAIEVYVGEKGLLFWLNKIAYASIFIVIGGWIFFRFIGPSLNLYQLEAPPLAPTTMFKGP